MQYGAINANKQVSMGAVMEHRTWNQLINAVGNKFKSILMEFTQGAVPVNCLISAIFSAVDKKSKQVFHM